MILSNFYLIFNFFSDIICVEGYEFDRDCPVGQHFNAAGGECVPAIESDCAINEERCSPTADVAPFFITDTRDCTSYYLCMRNAWLELTCAPGFFFDVHNRWCQVPEEVECVVSCKY